MPKRRSEPASAAQGSSTSFWWWEPARPHRLVQQHLAPGRVHGLGQGDGLLLAQAGLVGARAPDQAADVDAPPDQAGQHARQLGALDPAQSLVAVAAPVGEEQQVAVAQLGEDVPALQHAHRVALGPGLVEPGVRVPPLASTQEPSFGTRRGGHLDCVPAGPVVELLGAVRKTLRERRLLAEPFLLVGIIASIKEIVVMAGAERPKEEGFEAFRNGMIEIGVLSAVVLVLAITALLIIMREEQPDEGLGNGLRNDLPATSPSLRVS